MDGLNVEVVQAAIDVDKAQTTDCNASAGIEHLDQFMVLASITELVLNHPKHLRWDSFELVSVLVRQARANLDRVAP